MIFKRLRAKSGSGDNAPEYLFLNGHLKQALGAARRILDATADQQLLALGLGSTQWGDRLRRVVQLAAAIHDLGKANDHFQEMIAGKRKLQGLRHEWVALLMLDCFRLGEWLLPALDGNELDMHIVTWAICGHHPKYQRPSPPLENVDGAGHQMTLLGGHEDFGACLRWLEDTFKLAEPPSATDHSISLGVHQEVFSQLIEYVRQESQIWESLGVPERRFVAAVKCSLIAADIAGSALPTMSAPNKRWIAEAFSRKPTPEQLGEILQQRLTDPETGRVHDLRPFQKDVATSKATITLVKAGCGTGKTLAAYHWAQQRWPRKRLYFCYPTTGTATEGFREYLVSGESPLFDACLFHGRASIDLEMLKVRGDDSDAQDALIRIESLDAWRTPIVSCTVDVVLGLIQNNRRGIYAWPALADAAFVFDEIHAYDDQLFGALLRFLQALPGVPVLLMTASLPRARFMALQLCLRRSGREEIQKIDGPQEIEHLPRYHQMMSADACSPLSEVNTELAAGGRVLWVCNTIKRVMAAGDEAENSGLHPLLYHSRFRYCDRVLRHKAVVDAFNSRAGTEGALAICSQVAEMSLDLSATMLVTELAPVPALIQRLGRLNRRAGPCDPTRPFVVIVPPTPLPYSSAEFESAQRWLSKLPKSISQHDLSSFWESEPDVDSRAPNVVASAWLDGGPFTEVSPLREPSPGISVVLKRDADDILTKRRSLMEVVLPMDLPRHLSREVKNWEFLRGIPVPVAPDSAIDYCPVQGAKWR